MRSIVCVGVLLIAALLCGCAQEPQPEPSANPDPQTAVDPKASFPTPLHSDHLPNAFRLHEKVISGGQPDGEAAFQELRDLGVKTIITVDGAKPDAETARRYGLRYVHLPHGYDGIPDGRARELARAVRDLPGPIYIHCHHGKHRSPAAATVACVSVGFLNPDDAMTVLKTAGTSENYRGLYQAAESARRLDDALLDAVKVEFRETVDVPPLAQAMVAIEHTHDHLKSFAAARWQPLAGHPDLDAAHEALQLREHFTELLRTDDVQKRPERFREMIRDSEAAAGELENALRSAPAPTAPSTGAAGAFERVTKACTACHREFRDIPRSVTGDSDPRSARGFGSVSAMRPGRCRHRD